MQKLSEDALQDLFDDRTYERGLDYYENGHVLKPGRFNDIIYAKVIGNAPEPYEVSAKINGKDTFTRCTCPVGGMCKHGVALLLAWINEPRKFSDRNRILQALEKKSKEELLDIIKKAISEHPYLIDGLNIRAEGVKGLAEVDAGTLIKKIERILSDENSYYSTSVVKRLEGVRDAANTLMKGGRYADASWVYLELVGAGLTVFGDFIEDDDISDEAADLVEHSIKSFNECAPHANEAEKEELLDKIFRIIGLDQWGLDVEDLFYGVVTKENIGRLESRLMSGDKEPMEEDVVYYSRDGAINLLSQLYERLGIPEEKVRLAGSKLDNKEDYARLSNTLRGEGKFEESLDIAIKGLALDERASLELNVAYIKAAYLVAKKNPGMLDFDVTLNVALEIMSGRFDAGRFDLVSDVFRLMGRYDDFKSAMLRSPKKGDSIILALLHAGDVDKAVAIASTNPQTDEHITMKVAEVAAKKGMHKEAAKLISTLIMKRKAHRLYSYSLPDKLMSVMVSHLEMPELKKVCEHVINARLPELAVELMPRLAKRDPELSMPLIMQFGHETPANTIGTVALAIGKTQPEEGLKLCKGKIKDDLLISHSRYDEAILLLKVIKELYESEGRASEWTRFIRNFSSDNRGKKKLIGKIEAAFS